MWSAFVSTRFLKKQTEINTTLAVQNYVSGNEGFKGSKSYYQFRAEKYAPKVLAAVNWTLGSRLWKSDINGAGSYTTHSNCSRYS